MLKSVFALLLVAFSVRSSFAGDIAHDYILDGQPADNQLYSMVANVTFHGGRCTGERIAPGWLITAAHCVAEAAPAESVTFYDETGSVISTFEVTQAIAFPGYSKFNPLPDLALIQFSGDYESSPSFALPSNTSSVAPGTQVAMAGFGETLPKLTYYRSVIETISDELSDPRVNSSILNSVAWKNFWQGIDTSSLVLVKASGTQRNGPGDSGGPIYTRNADGGGYALLAVIRGNDGPGGDRNNTVADIGTAIASPSVLDFIRQYIDSK
jgi:secreted trypsin-like serine protease